jgi:hypothetical protein
MEVQEAVVIEDLLNAEKQVTAFTALVRLSLTDSIQSFAPYIFKVGCLRVRVAVVCDIVILFILGY